MALVKCKECGTEVSSKAASCPKCGVTVKARSGCLGKAIAAVFVVFIIGMVASVVSPPPPSTSGAQADAESAPGENKAARASAFVSVLKQSLRNPKSFQPVSVIVTEEGAVCATYRAENGFGGMNVENAVMSADMKKALNSTEEGFATLWNRECADKPGLETKHLF